jgi:Zn-dependent protease
MQEIAGIQFDRREVIDLAAAWVALGLAFTLFIGIEGTIQSGVDISGLGRLFAISMLTVGTGFLLHELAHKVVAIRFGQVAAFRADYGMLGIAIASALAGFLFAVPGAVYHRGRITEKQNGLISVAGPVTNLALAAIFLPIFLVGPGIVGEIGRWGLLVNVFLAAFNMIPVGPLDGKSVMTWSKPVFALVLGVAVGAGAVLFLYVL